MLHRFLADAVLIVHLLFVLFVISGGLLALRWPRLAWMHLPALLWGAYVEFTGRICPLTPLENSLRERGGEAGYSGGCIDHYVTTLIYPDGLTRHIQLALGIGLLLVNVVAYALLIRRLRRKLQTTADIT